MSDTSIRRFLRRRTSEGMCLALGHLRRELTVLRKHRRGLRQAKTLLGQKYLKLNLGCGSKLKKGWVNVDISRQADVTLDLRKPLPLEEGSCSSIWATQSPSSPS